MSGKTPLVFEVDLSGAVLDRLVGLHQFISPGLIRQAVDETGRRNRRDFRLTHEIMLWVVLAMGILTDLPLRQVFKHARRLARRQGRPCLLILQASAGAELQAEEGKALVLAHLVELHDVWVLQPGDRLGLAPKAGQVVRTGVRSRQDHFFGRPGALL